MQLYGLIGYPLAHSFSKEYFKQKFRSLGLDDYDYQNFPIKRIEEFPKLLASEEELRGLNVTIPYKESVRAYLDVVNFEAGQIGAVNTICFESIGLVGYNTDWIGFRESLAPMLTRWKTRPSALILGTGGAAKAVAYALTQLGVPFTFVSRTQKNNAFTYADLSDELIGNTQLIINTTPLGMVHQPETEPPLNYEAVSEQHLLYDLVYNPEVTPFLRKGIERGAEVKNGHEMLTLQAEASWSLWLRTSGSTLQG